MNVVGYRLYRMHGRNPVTAWLRANPRCVGLGGSFLLGIAFWTVVFLWLTK
jgi:hypothetical protein